MNVVSIEEGPQTEGEGRCVSGAGCLSVHASSLHLVLCDCSSLSSVAHLHGQPRMVVNVGDLGPEDGGAGSKARKKDVVYTLNLPVCELQIMCVHCFGFQQIAAG